MNRSSIRQKRSIGKNSPLSKRPKLDFSLKNQEVAHDSHEFSTTPSSSFDKYVKHNTPNKSLENRSNGNTSNEPDWDDEFCGEIFEKVCLVADLSQAMANCQPAPEKLEQSKVNLCSKSKRSPASKRINLKSDEEEELEKLKLEFLQLQEKYKTKEGEVHILRSQLKQNEEIKQAAAVNSIKAMEEIQKKYNEKITLTERELETFKTKLQFKDMEFKTLSDRFRQLEYTMTKSKSNDVNASQCETMKSCNTFSQMLNRNMEQAQDKKIDDYHPSLKSDINFLDLEYKIFSPHEGKHLEECLCPEIFQFIEEPSVSHFYTFKSEINYYRSKLEFGKREKYKSFDLPKQKTFLKDLYDSISSLFIYESFNDKKAKRTIHQILNHIEKILEHVKEVVLFLKSVHVENYEYLDEYLLENEREVKVLKIKELLQGKKLSAEECGIEGRRTLALVYALMITSQVAVDHVKNKPNFITILKTLAATIGTLRRPLSYTGVLVGISYILQRLLLEDNLTESTLKSINEIVEELIFSRPKLDVLIEIVNVLSFGKNHLNFMMNLCRKATLDSCSLYMDSSLRQAMFFTKNACPLKLLCMQIMGLACLPSSNKIIWETTNSIIKWLNNSMSNPKCKNIKWLPVNSLANEDKCFDVTECLVNLLTFCLKYYLSKFSYYDFSENAEVYYKLISRGESSSLDEEKEKLINVIGHGAILFKRIIKTSQKQLHDNLHSIRFLSLLKSLMLEKSEAPEKRYLNATQIQAINWLTDLLEGDANNQNYCLKQTTSTIPEIEILSALKVDDDSKIY